jgi:hypothetical protein
VSLLRHCSYACSACSVAAASAPCSCCCAQAIAAGVPNGHPSVGAFCSHTGSTVVVVVGGTIVVVVAGIVSVVVVKATVDDVVELFGRAVVTTL